MAPSSPAASRGGRGHGGERERGKKLGVMNPGFILRGSSSCQKLMGVCRQDPAPADAKAFRSVPCEGGDAAKRSEGG